MWYRSGRNSLRPRAVRSGPWSANDRRAVSPLLGLAGRGGGAGDADGLGCRGGGGARLAGGGAGRGGWTGRRLGSHAECAGGPAWAGAGCRVAAVCCDSVADWSRADVRGRAVCGDRARLAAEARAAIAASGADRSWLAGSRVSGDDGGGAGRWDRLRSAERRGGALISEVRCGDRAVRGGGGCGPRPRNDSTADPSADSG